MLQKAHDSRAAIESEIVRLTHRQALETLKTAAHTAAITKKAMELAEESITEVVRDRFTRETERLKLDRVTLARTKAERGTLLHQPKLVNARQAASLPVVFSEGERTALGLAAFFTDAVLDESKSTLILDDPVTSLDHGRRGTVAVRLSELAESRQVILFTHDRAFVRDLKREAAQRNVHVCERSVFKPRGDNQRPGACAKTHPWNTRNVGTRLHDLRTQLAGIRRDQPSWDADTYESKVGNWAGRLSETWEEIVHQEIVNRILAEGGIQVQPTMLKILARFTPNDDAQFQASYRRISEWATRHNKAAEVNYVAPEVSTLEEELKFVEDWWNRVKKYRE